MTFTLISWTFYWMTFNLTELSTEWRLTSLLDDILAEHSTG